MKMNNAKNNVSIVCPVCKKTSDIVRIYSITVDSTPLMLHDEIGELYQCQNPECLSYLIKARDRFEPISKIELIRRQKEITDLLVAESEVARSRVYPKGMEAALKAEMAEALSGVLYHLSAESPYHRAYGIDEILEACEKLGFNPSKVDNRRIGFVLNWLKENKP